MMLYLKFRNRVLVLVTLCIFAISPLIGQLISEIEPNPNGTDPSTQSLELSGIAGTNFDGWILSIESDFGVSSLGMVDRAEMISGTFDANGLLVVTIADLENPGFTLVLLDNFTGSTSTDIDTDNDGVADDLSTFGNVYDAIGIPDATNDEATLYGAQLGGQDFVWTGDEPQLIFRDASIGKWAAINDPVDGVFDIMAMNVGIASFNTDPTTSTFGAINPSSPFLPVSIIKFDGSHNGYMTELIWETAYELNNKGFEVQHSTNGKTWERLGFVPGTINSNVVETYTFKHQDPKEGLNLYRLKQVDLDGQYDLSHLVMINFVSHRIFRVFPNPTTGTVYFRGDDVLGPVRVFDMAGRVLITKTITAGQIELGAYKYEIE